MKLPKHLLWRPVIRVDYELLACCEIPKWYGVAYQRFSCAQIVMAWIPLNLFMRLWHVTYCWVKTGSFWPPRRKIMALELEELRARNLDQQKHIQELHQIVSKDRWESFRAAERST